MININREKTILKLQQTILNDYKPTNAKEFEILGRALSACRGIAILDDGSIYYTITKRNYTNADWRASELINEAIKQIGG